MQGKIESPDTCSGHIRFFYKNAIDKLAAIGRRKFLPVVINGETILLNESGLSSELYALHEEKSAIMEKRIDLFEDREAGKIFEHDYQRESAVLRKQCDDIRRQIAELEQKEMDTTGFLLGSGGSKKFYDIGHGKALMLPNLDAKYIGKKDWARIIYEESLIADMLGQYGLMSQTYQSVTVTVEGASFTTLQTDSFPALANKGLQVRDLKNRCHYGRSMLFGDYDHINPPFIKNMLEDICQDITVLLAHQININGASFNLVICDSEDAGQPDEKKPVLYSEAGQKIRLYLYDYSIEHRTKLDTLYLNLCGDDGDPNREEIAKQANGYLNLAIYSIKNAITNDEMEQLIAQVPRSSLYHSERINYYFIDQQITKAFEAVKQEMIDDIVAAVVDNFNPSCGSGEGMIPVASDSLLPPLAFQ
ncbi:hypothetical protein [Legionella spiritensis]|uniref:Uncharacterized protein n=1 Tax=Legionella spiritensis TaxID=452 RepID=A0A0W0YXB9_LEGSP|nr:hypothetical protein [Legionella spiritensis]KTD61557.1 hypothetical protein Lspi_2187 [Legionella spiritensis]SNV32501.1 Uncharacterised protein [Legionella spiritensis]